MIDTCPLAWPEITEDNGLYLSDGEAGASTPSTILNSSGTRPPRTVFRASTESKPLQGRNFGFSGNDIWVYVVERQ